MNKNSIDDLVKNAKIKLNSDNIFIRAWVDVFGSTSGPRSGMGGQSVTPFQVFAFDDQNSDKSILWCAGLWKTGTIDTISWK
jgi:hypothetical protein